MSIEWSGLSPEIPLALDRQSPFPLGTQLEAALRDAIRTGRLSAGERLPSSRELARQLSVSRGLVQDCFAQLAAEGYLTTHPGSATRVAPLATASPPATPALTPPAPPLSADFASGVPDLASFPRADWLWAQREACRTAPSSALGYGDPQGSEVFRAVLAGYLRRVRSAVVEPSNLLVCTGFAQGLHLVLRALARDGVSRVAFEDPGFGQRTVLAAARLGITAVPVPVDHDGIDVAALARSGVSAAVLTPAHQWPTGVVLAPHRRQALLNWAERQRATIIEDDYDAEFRYDRDPVGALQGLAPQRVLLLGTVSKSLAPGMRLGWIAGPSALIGVITREKDLLDRGGPALDQLALAALMRSGRYDRHLRRMRALYTRRRAALTEALAEHAPPVTLTGLAAGFHAVAHLPAGASEAGVIAAARSRSVGLHGMSRHRADGATTPPQLILGFGNLGERSIRDGIATVGGLLTAGVS
jgi:GntR family transcriptional regulator/MocR family aminotransferase